MTQTIIYIIVIATCLLFVFVGPGVHVWWEHRYQRRHAQDGAGAYADAPTTTVKDNNGKRVAVVDYPQLLRDTLAKLNCEVTQDAEDPERIHFTYQGLNFFADSRAGVPYVDIFLTWWEQVSLDNLEDVAAMQKAVNRANTIVRSAAKVIYSYDNDSHLMAVHSYANIIFQENIPRLDRYLSAVFDQFFALSRCVLDEFSKEKAKESASTEQ